MSKLLVNAVAGTAGVGAAVALVLLLVLIAPVIVMFLWNNALVGAVAGVAPIGLLQALGITILANILFKSNVSVSNNKK